MSPTLVPDPACLAVDSIRCSDQSIQLLVHVSQSAAACPLCGQPASRVHSRYVRTLTDLPWLEVPVQIRLTIRRLHCATPDCPRQIFAERVPQLAAPYARRTLRLHALLTVLAFALGGEAGARIGRHLVVGVSPATLLRLIRRTTLPSLPLPRILGIDDWSLRKGVRYGTILVDLERQRVVDLLAGRDGATVQQWLLEHPGVQVIARDRGGSYADAGRRGAPAALQVADRFHLVTNLHAALRRLVERHTSLLRSVEPLPDPAQHAVPSLARQADQSQQRYRRRVERYAAVRQAWEQGASMRRIAAEFGMGRNAITRYLTTGIIPRRGGSTAASSPLAPYRPVLQQIWETGEQRPTVLLQLLHEHGYRGSIGPITRQTSLWRVQDPAGERAPPPRMLTVARIAWLLLLPDADLAPAEQTALTHLLAAAPHLATARTLALAFRSVLATQSTASYAAWQDRARTCQVREMVSFARSLERDAGAVEAAITSPWSNGPTEGHINRLKTIKRQMYGRANFDLVRQRVLWYG